MSYRNPGDIRIADPGAFMKAFEAKVQPVIEELKKKKEERKKEAKKYDSDVAKFNESMNYPEWAKTLNAEAASSLKSIINKKYIDNGRFKDASESERQEIFDEINIGIGQSLNKVNGAIQLSYNEILPGDFEDNPEFLSFIKNVPSTSKLNITEVDGEPAFSYTVGEETKTLRADQIPDGVGDYKGRSAINEKYNGLLAAGVKSIDEKLKKREELGVYEASQDGQKTAMGIFSQLDQRERNYIFEEAQIDINGDEEGGVIAYADIKDEEAREAADQVIIESIKKRIEDDSVEIGRIKSDEVVKLRKAREEKEKELREQGIQDQKDLAVAMNIDANIQAFGFGDRNPAGEVLGTFDGSILEDKNAKQKMEAAARNAGFEIGAAIVEKDEEGEPILDDAGNPTILGVEMYPIGKSSQKFVIENGTTPQQMILTMLQYRGIKAEKAAKVKTEATQSKASTATGGLPIL